MDRQRQQQPLRIVVAEDEALIRMDLVEMLAREGYEVVGEAANGEAAIALVREHKPDLALFDVKMPIKDGISAAQELRGEVPIVMLTAFSQRELIERANDAGVMAYLVKPFTISDLIPAIEVARTRFFERALLESEVATLEGKLEARKLVERAKGLLMHRHGLTEGEAFTWIQRGAMDRRLSMVEVARELLGGSVQ
ncbi:MAG: response regulator [Actinobacteria bacterium]|nr:response regulator [Actinomycetota bacterium]